MPAPRSPRRSAISVQLMTQFGLDQGLSLEQCLAGTGLDWRLLGDPGAEVEAGQELELLRNLSRLLGQRPGVGLQAGRRYRLNTYGIWGFALLSSATYRSAVQLGLRYLDTGAMYRAVTWLALDRQVSLEDGDALASLAESAVLEIVDDRYDRGSLLITSQVPISAWHDVVGDPTLADAILDRVLHTAYRIELRGESLRKRGARETNEA